MSTTPPTQNSESHTLLPAETRSIGEGAGELVDASGSFSRGLALVRFTTLPPSSFVSVWIDQSRTQDPNWFSTGRIVRINSNNIDVGKKLIVIPVYINAMVGPYYRARWKVEGVGAVFDTVLWGFWD